MEKTDEKLAAFIEKLQEAGFTQAPELIDGAVRATYADGVVSIVFLIIFAVMFVVFLNMFMKGVQSRNNNTQKAGAVGALLNVLFIILWSTNNPFLKFIDPQASLYQKILNGIL